MTEIYVIRHVQAEGNLYRHMQGHWDGDVTPLGRRQQEALSLRFRDIPVDAVYSSDLYRARFTAAAVTRFHPLPIRTDARLREINIGPWETVPFGNVIHDSPALIESFMHDPEHFQMPGAETYHQVRARAMEALREIAASNPGRTVVIASHGVTIRCLLTGLLGLSLNDTETVPICGNTAVSHLFYDDGVFTVDYLNDSSHLSEAENPRARDSVSLRHVCIDPARFRETYIDCYADAWRTAHGDLTGFNGEVYYRAALEHYQADPQSVMLLYDGDSLAGLVDLDPSRSAHLNSGWVTLLYLRPEYRGRGLGVQALGRAVSHYKQLGRTALRLHVAEDNAAALAFYRKWEFEELSRTPGAQGQLLLLEKTLRRAEHGTV